MYRAFKFSRTRRADEWQVYFGIFVEVLSFLLMAFSCFSFGFAQAHFSSLSQRSTPITLKEVTIEQLLSIMVNSIDYRPRISLGSLKSDSFIRQKVCTSDERMVTHETFFCQIRSQIGCRGQMGGISLINNHLSYSLTDIHAGNGNSTSALPHPDSTNEVRLRFRVLKSLSSCSSPILPNDSQLHLKSVIIKSSLWSPF